MDIELKKLKQLVRELIGSEPLAGIIESTGGPEAKGLVIVLKKVPPPALQKIEEQADLVLHLSGDSLETLDSLQQIVRRNRELEEDALKDPLTSLINYRQFVTQLNIEMERVKRTERPCSLMIIDLDHFKPVNDQFGHQTGNDVLKDVAQIILEKVRTVDVAARYGGDEFAVIMPDTSVTRAVRTAERIRQSFLTDSRIKDYKVTASFGLADYHCLDNKKPNDLVKHADLAMYQAKREGGNRVRLHEPDRDKEKPAMVSVDEKKALLGKPE